MPLPLVPILVLGAAAYFALSPSKKEGQRPDLSGLKNVPDPTGMTTPLKSVAGDSASGPWSAWTDKGVAWVQAKLERSEVFPKEMKAGKWPTAKVVDKTNLSAVGGTGNAYLAAQIRDIREVDGWVVWTDPQATEIVFTQGFPKDLPANYIFLTTKKLGWPRKKLG